MSTVYLVLPSKQATDFPPGGTSAGGNITATIAHQFRDDKITPGLTGCLLMIPAWCAGAHLPEKYKSEVTSPEQ